MKLSDYLDSYSWSQADLADKAQISSGSVSRALAGEPIVRRNASKIVKALDREHRDQGGVGHITLRDIKGLRITKLKRKKRKTTDGGNGEEPIEEA